MPDIKLNFSTQWPSIGIAKVIAPGSGTKVEHGLDYAPFACAYGTEKMMRPLSVDKQYVYADNSATTVVFAVDISKGNTYPTVPTSIGEIPTLNPNDNVDLRKFLLHSRAVSPMMLAVNIYTAASGQTAFTYTSPLSHPVFMFGWIGIKAGQQWGSTTFTHDGWSYAPQGGQAYPALFSDGFTGTLTAIASDEFNPFTGSISIMALRNPAIITNNTVQVSY